MENKTYFLVDCLNEYDVDSDLLGILGKVRLLKSNGIPYLLCDSIEMFKKCASVFGSDEIYLNFPNSDNIDMFDDVVLDDGSKYKLYVVCDYCCPFDTFEKDGKEVRVERSLGVLVSDGLYQQICNMAECEYGLKSEYTPRDSLFDNSFKGSSLKEYLEHMKTNYKGYVSSRKRDLEKEVDSLTKDILKLSEELASLVNKKNKVESDIDELLNKASIDGGLDSYVNLNFKLKL